jgi:MoxR-like ATPase
MAYDPASSALEGDIRVAASHIEKLRGEIGRRIVGQRGVIDRLIMALIAEGHVLLEGLPGLAKTTSIKALGDAASLTFSRVQFTPDLLPADVIGTQIYDPKTGEFRVKKGPIFAHLVLADEINRAPAKVQSALLEAMQERQVTIGETSFKLARPFLVLATQNPIEQEGTYPLPEAQVDRFLFKVKVGYGTPAEEQEIIARSVAESVTKVEKVIGEGEIVHMQQLAAKVHVAEKVRRYIVDLVFATRKLDGESPSRRLADLAPLIEVGASPRASINLEKAARVNALMQGRGFVTPQDVKDVGLDVMRHRIMPTYEAEAENISSDEIVRRVFERVDVP